MKKKFKVSISIQISIFLIIAAFIPVVVMMALNTYEKQQLVMLENSNVQQGRIVAASLCNDKIDRDVALKLLQNMNNQFDSRIRIIDASGELLCDSATIQLKNEKTVTDRGYPSPASIPPEKQKIEAKRSIIYRIFSFPIRKYRKWFRPPVEDLYDNADFYSEKKVYDGEEIQTALKGKYGAKTRISSGDQVSVTLYSAVPVFRNKSENDVAGVVLVSRSTYKILQNLYELRLELAKIFLRSLFVILIIAVFLALRISFPLKKLSKQASDCADLKGHIFFTDFTGKKRRDEIGELSRSFSSLIERLNKRIKFNQAFSSDISHEFKNPLAAIRTSAEVLSDDSDTLQKEDRIELSGAIITEVDHLQTLLNGVRKISRIDAEEVFSDKEIPLLPVNEYIKNIISSFQNKYPDVKFEFVSQQENLVVKIPEDYLYRIFENLIDNAASFSTKVVVKTEVIEQKNCSYCIFTVEDNGKGISEEAKQKIFNRFYSERPEQVRDNHTGLGLSIVKAIVDALEGQIEVGRSQSLGGASFTIQIRK